MIARSPCLCRHVFRRRNGKVWEPSNGWLEGFKKRYDIKSVSATGEALSADVDAAKDFLPAFRDFIHRMGYGRLCVCACACVCFSFLFFSFFCFALLSVDAPFSPPSPKPDLRFVFNMDESALLFQLVPTTTLSSAWLPEAKGIKQKKTRLSFVLCCNADGSKKIRPTIIGHHLHPRCFKKNQPKGVHYFANKTAWMNEEVFSAWLKLFVAEVRQMKREHKVPEDHPVILLLDNHSGHIATGIQHPEWLTIFYLPANTTSLIQPLDGGIIAAVKLKYKWRMVRKAIDVLDAEPRLTLEEFAKKVTVSDAINMFLPCWSDIEPAFIERVFRSTLLDADPDGLVPGDRNHRVSTEVQALRALLRELPGAAEGSNDFCNEAFERLPDDPPTIEEIIDSRLINAPPPRPENEERDDCAASSGTCAQGPDRDSHLR